MPTPSTSVMPSQRRSSRRSASMRCPLPEIPDRLGREHAR
jgi:hypothetical protein